MIGAFASATQDIAVDAWRIDVADERTPVELLSAVYQFGYRTASIVGGAFALAPRGADAVGHRLFRHGRRWCSR